MKGLKRVFAGLVCGVSLLAALPVQVFAADGSIAFSDPETAVGDNFDVKVAVDTTSENIGSVELTINYDSNYLRYDSGDSGVTKESDGTLKYVGSGGSTEEKFVITFQALQQGSSQISLASYNVTGSSSGTALSLEEGSGAVTIAEGDASKITTESSSSASKATDGDGVEITIDGEKYTLSSEFADNDIPTGFSVANVQYEGAQRTMVANEGATVYLAYLFNSEGIGDFYYFNSEDATFSKCAQIAISSDTNIIVYNASGISVPDNYKSTTLTLDGKEFSIWQDPNEADYYLLYAVGKDGTKGFYRYDSSQGTYQRFDPTDTASASTSGDKSKGKASGILGKIKNVVNSYFTAIFVIVTVLFVLILIRLIVVRVKLRNRDIELDDIYDQYGIDMDEEEEPAPKKKKKDKKEKKGKKAKLDDTADGPAVRKPQKTAQFEFTEDFGELDYEDDFEEDDYEEDDYDDDVDYYEEEEDYDDYEDEEDEDEDEGIIDDLDDLLEEKPKKKRGHIEDDDTFKIDFVDL